MNNFFLDLYNCKVCTYFVLFSAITGLIVFPVISKYAHTIASPYSKANTFKRLCAASIDAFLFLLFCYFFFSYSNAFFWFSGAAYVLFKDALFGGRSLGKFLCGLMVVRLHDGQPCTLTQSVLRNVIFVFPGMNVVAVIWETALIFKNKQGMRLGDKLARTQVVEGMAAPELVKSAQIILSYYKDLAEKELSQKEVEKV